MKKTVYLLLIALLIAMSSVFPAFAAEEESINSIKSVYELDSGIIGYPSVTFMVDDSNDLDGLVTEKKTPAMAILRLGAGVELNVVDKDGKVIAPLYNVLKNSLGNKIIPAFYLTDSSCVSKLNAFIDQYELRDCLVVSPNADVIKSVVLYEDNGGFTRRRPIGAMLEVNDVEGLCFGDLSVMASAAGARCVLIDLDAYSSAELKNFKTDYSAKSLSIYTKISGKTEAYKAVACGVDAVLTDNYVETIEVFESFKETTLVRPITVQAHRGMDAVYNENSLEGIYAAALCGVNTIEIDPRLTKDNQIVLVHDEDVARVTDYLVNGKVSDYTLSQLKAMNVIENRTANPSKICTLEEVFELYKEKGLTTKLALDAKEINPEYVNVLYDLIEKHDAWSIIASIGIADGADRQAFVQKFGGKLSYDGLSAVTVGSDGNLESLIKNWTAAVNGTVKTVGAVAPYYTYFIKTQGSTYVPEINRAMRDRGIKLAPYQFDKPEEIEAAFKMDFVSLSTGNAAYLADFLNTYTVDAITVQKGDEFTVTSKEILLNGTERSVNVKGFIVVEGDASFIETDGEVFTAKEVGKATIMAYTSFTKGNLTYRVYSDIIEINAENELSERSENVKLIIDEQPTDNPTGEKDPDIILPILCSVGGALLIAGGIVTFIFVRRKKRNG